MAGRFLYQRLSSRVSEPISRLFGSRASVSAARDVTRHVSEVGIGAVPFHRVTRPGTTNHGAPRCYNGLLTARTSKPTTGTPSVTIAFADSLQQTLSSSCSARVADDISESKIDAKRDARLAELEADKATLREDDYEAEKAAIIEDFAAAKARKAKLDKLDIEVMFFLGTLWLFFGLVMSFLLTEIISEYKRQNGKGENSKVAAAK